ncbi:reverse transcriptase [Tanacetum coccineum]
MSRRRLLASLQAPFLKEKKGVKWINVDQLALNVTPADSAHPFKSPPAASQDETTGPSVHPEDATSTKMVRETLSHADAESGGNSEKINSETDTEILNVGDEQEKVGSNFEQSHVALAGPNPEHMHDVFLATNYPKIATRFSFEGKIVVLQTAVPNNGYKDGKIKGVKKEALHTLKAETGSIHMLSESMLTAELKDDILETSDAMDNPSQPFEFLLKETCIHNEDGNPARAKITQALESFKDGDGDGDTHNERSHKGVKASANSDIIFFFTSAQDGNRLLDDERLSLADDLKKAHDHNQNKFVIVFIDDILVYLKMREEHENHLRIVLEVLPDDIPLDPAKVEAITKWARPTTVTEFVWNKEREKIFEERKRRLVSSPVLTLPSGTCGYQIYSDASMKGLGCVLMQHGKAYRLCIEAPETMGTDTLSRKNSGIMACLKIQHEIIKDLELMEVELVASGSEDYIASLKIEHNLILWIKEAQKEYGELWSVLENLKRNNLNEVGEWVIEGPELVEVTNKKVSIAKEKLKEAHSRQKSYADCHQRVLEFKPEDRVFLKVTPYCIGEVSYHLTLPPQLSHVHNVCRVSLLRGYYYHSLHITQYPFDKIREDLSFVEEPEAILDCQERVMRKKTIPLVKVIWKNNPKREATWENEEMMQTDYPYFFSRFGSVQLFL